VVIRMDTFDNGRPQGFETVALNSCVGSIGKAGTPILVGQVMIQPQL
jgi:hypothetical protein